MRANRESSSLIFLTIVAALLLSLLPMPGLLEPLKPYWVALVMIYWTLETGAGYPQWKPDGNACFELGGDGFPGTKISLPVTIFPTLATGTQCAGFACKRPDYSDLDHRIAGRTNAHLAILVTTADRTGHLAMAILTAG